jgi:quercetin dioxygenase-like cupin family protein
MENKANEATPQRPEGDRLLNAPLVDMDLNKFISQIRSEPTWADSDHNAITIYKSEIVRIVLIGMHDQAVIKTHAAGGVITLQVLEGSIEFITEERTVTLEKGQMVALQEKILHSVQAKKDSFFLLTLILK